MGVLRSLCSWAAVFVGVGFFPSIAEGDPTPAPASDVPTNAPPPSAAAPVPAPATPTARPVKNPSSSPPSNGFELDRATTWDFDVEGAFGRYVGESDRWTGFVRARAGILFVRDPIYDAIGLTWEYSSLSKATFGVQVELMRIDHGFWLQLGGLVDVSGHPGALVSGGWSLFGAEAQYRSYDGLGSGVAFYVKLRLPLGVIAYGLRSGHAGRSADVERPKE